MKTILWCKATLYVCLFSVLSSYSAESFSTPNSPTGLIEKKYYANGPWNVSVKLGGACCDSKGNPFDFYYPTNLGANGFKHPIITWGNGTFGKTQQVAYFLRHMASWGFVIVGTQDQFTGTGDTILDASKFLVKANSDASIMNGLFHNKLNVNEIGAIGHSQGAGGAIFAMMKSQGSIKTVIPIELPSQAFCLNCKPADILDTSKITQGSVFFIDGSLDIPVSPPIQPSHAPGLQSIAAYYAAVPDTIPKLKGTLIGPTHNDICGQPSCVQAPIPCTRGVYGYLGYPTAWMVDRLGIDSSAHAAFVSGSGEIFSQPKNWAFVKSNIQ